MITELNERSREIFRTLVEAYVETGEPVGSRTISRRIGVQLSPATIRNVMADLEESGLLHSPHASAGRLPTDAGLRLFVNGLLEIGHLSEDERRNIDGRCAATGRSLNEVMEQVSTALSGLTHCAGLVYSPKIEKALKHVEFVSLGPGRALVVMVSESGLVENRVLELPAGITPSMLMEASNYLNARIAGRTIDEARLQVRQEIDEHRAQLGDLSQRVVEAGLATWSGGAGDGYLIVRGRANLLDDVTAIGDLERIRALFEALETKESLLRLIDATSAAHGVQIYIGADNELFSLAGCSMIVAPFSNSRDKVVGAIGVIGPTRMNYARIIPMVDYTAKLIRRHLA
jgi:heat-inducible transcriptional repressor